MEETLIVIKNLYLNSESALKRINRTRFQFQTVFFTVYLPLVIFILIMHTAYFGFRSPHISYIWNYGLQPAVYFMLKYFIFLFLLVLAAHGAAHKVFLTFSHVNINKRVLFCGVPALFAKGFAMIPLLGGIFFFTGVIFSVYLFRLGFQTDRTVPQEKLTRFFSVLSFNVLFLTLSIALLWLAGKESYNLILSYL